LMKLSQILKWSTLGGVLLCFATSSSALTLGRVRGAAILGQPLELTVPVQIAVDEDVSGLCFEADVFYGENRQNASRVVVTNEASRPGLSAVVRVVAHTHVDEPVVTVYLRSGCGQQTTRRYVLLADLASEVVPTVVRPPAASEPAFAYPQSRAVKPLGRNGAGSVAHGANPETSKKAVPPPQATGPGLTQAMVHSHSKPTTKNPVAGQPRLRLALVDLTQDWEPALKISSELVFSPMDDVKKREEAKALWRALNASLEDILRDNARVQDMESNVKLLQDQTSKNRLTMLELAGRLDKAQSQRYFNPLIYGLIALLIACGVALAHQWRRWRSASAGATPWWRDQHAPENTGVRAPESLLKGGLLQPGVNPVVTKVPAFAESPVVGLTEVDIDLQLAESAFSDLGKPAPFHSKKIPGILTSLPKDNVGGHRDFTHSVPGTMGEIHSQEMLDARQQADFFMTLGQYDDAIHVLEGCIHDSGEFNPLVYLDLLNVFHTLSRKADYERYRTQFNQLFTGLVPEYASFNDGGNGIEDYAEVLEQIVALWPTKEALEHIEKCMVRTAEPAAVQGVRLDAFRDLLMLHGVVKQLTSHVASGLSSSHTAGEHAFPVPHVADQPGATLPQFCASGLSVDLDLSEPMSNGIEFDAAGSPSRQPVLRAQS